MEISKYKGECKCGAKIDFKVENATLNDKFIMCPVCKIHAVKIEKDN